jgi:hypothetical protein
MTGTVMRNGRPFAELTVRPPRILEAPASALLSLGISCGLVDWYAARGFTFDQALYLLSPSLVAS